MTQAGEKPEKAAPESAETKRDVARSEVIARKLAKVAPDDDPAQVAGAIAILAAETIKRSANTLPEARAYLDGLRAGIDGLLVNAFPDAGKKDGEGEGAARKE